MTAKLQLMAAPVVAVAGDEEREISLTFKPMERLLKTICYSAIWMVLVGAISVASARYFDLSLVDSPTSSWSYTDHDGMKIHVVEVCQRSVGVWITIGDMAACLIGVVGVAIWQYREGLDVARKVSEDRQNV